MEVILKDNKLTTKKHGVVYCEKYVKEAVLKFKEELNKTGEWGLNKDNALKKYKVEKFGDFEK